MSTATVSRSSTRSGTARPLSTAGKVGVGALVFNTLLYIFLIVNLFSEHKTVNAGLYVIPIGDALLAGALLFARRHWEWLAAAGFLLVMLFFTGQHDVPEVLHPSQVPHTVFAVLALIVPVVGIIGATLSFRHSLQPLDSKEPGAW